MELDVRNKGTIPVIHHADFSVQGYRVIRELGRNHADERITYLATDCKSQQTVVIKEFNLANETIDWSGSKAYEREIAILQQLEHPRIPRYINSFATSKNFYLVQEYKNAVPLGTKDNFSPAEIKQVAISLLEILVYLQQQIDPMIHRDIKPENVLVDEQLNAYLVDFGLARQQSAKIALTTLSAGTPGFIPPEEQFGYALTPASDLYSVGATLICLLTNTQTANIGYGGLKFPKLENHFHPSFRSWLWRMVQPNWKDRYPNAASALVALKSIPVTGKASVSEILLAAMKLKKRTAMLALAALGMLAVGLTTLVFSQPGGATQQLEESQSLIDIK
ncbi:serine/threonine protein kinase [Nostoc piscinale CENA21]|uniref:non-specific serine/threonine protein kinase n=1 Tax=Nostoc piscinale CENA21 TaxID=224013 RepID=A0A0M3V4F0_9NOSO|nr:serine/threonine-protein kinase [Nostoc piscinale]ALF51827.1 serine/threonine protein kinase [Nostoc piscinale CENA21]